MEMNLDDEAIVLEMGMDRFGDIRTLTNIANPDIAVITNIGDSHRIFFFFIFNGKFNQLI